MTDRPPHAAVRSRPANAAWQDHSFTIVTPSYQHRTYLEATLQSVLSQEGDFRLDYVVMDGGSRDGTVELLAEYERRVNSGDWPVRCRGIEFRWFSEPDRGQPHAVNKGFRLATGRLLGWLNSDDVYPDRRVLARCLAFFDRHPDAQFVYGKGYRIDGAGQIVGEEEYVTKYPIEDLPEIDMILQPAAFWRREVFDLVGPLNETMHYAFDWEYWLRCRQRFPLHFLDEFLACNRFHEATKTNTGGIKRKREIAELLLRLGAFTERSVRAYLTTPEPPPQQPAPATRRKAPKYTGWYGRIHPLLAPGRYVERRLRQLRDRMKAALAAS